MGAKDQNQKNPFLVRYVGFFLEYKFPTISNQSGQIKLNARL